jgi:probable H4MPT-linked C1 transfer pathway protein
MIKEIFLMKNEFIIMGLDIGGANTDCCIYRIKDNKATLINSAKEYLPMWEKKDQLEECLHNFKKDYRIDVVIATTTAELADGYTSKKEGVFDITSKVMNVFKDSIVKFVTFNGLKDFKYVKNNPLDAAAANWIATSHMISKISSDCIFMDMGTTTTDIIPIKNSIESARGHSDLERLCSGELVYTGMLRTNVATITNKIPIRDEKATVSSELFSTTADVHHILGNIKEEEYTCSTSDNEDTSIDSCKRRLARVICADLDMLTDEEINNIARHVEKEQINQITNALKKVHEHSKLDDVIITNYADAPICKKAACNLGLNITSLNDYLTGDSLNVSPTIGCVQMYIDEIGMDIQLLNSVG